MHGQMKRGGGTSATRLTQSGQGLPFQMTSRAGLRPGQVEQSVERLCDALSAAPLRVDGLRGIKLA